MLVSTNLKERQLPEIKIGNVESHQSFAEASSGSPSQQSTVRINLAHANGQFSFD
jgi:hypothetical protein